MKKELNASALSESKRNAEIVRLEQERINILREIEKTVAAFAKTGGNRKLARRKFRIGKGPQDFKKKDLDRK